MNPFKRDALYRANGGFAWELSSMQAWPKAGSIPGGMDQNAGSCWGFRVCWLEQFQESMKRFSREKRVALSLRELRQNKELGQFAVSVKR
ncbi:hypothetical protein [Mesorhizobium sophorae]|uniref:hypothetical protein n=1 Tax=Mesorhizobium sophorae TaxID=1300294 RepID=UPI000BA3B14E|nr:hypothetical protein [Mesorhizobium sophorae]